MKSLSSSSLPASPGADASSRRRRGGESETGDVSRRDIASTLEPSEIHRENQLLKLGFLGRLLLRPIRILAAAVGAGPGGLWRSVRLDPFTSLVNLSFFWRGGGKEPRVAPRRPQPTTPSPPATCPPTHPPTRPPAHPPTRPPALRHPPGSSPS